MPDKWDDPKVKWKIGEFLNTDDDILGGISIEDLLLVLRTSVRPENLNRDAVMKAAKDTLEMKLTDFWFIVENNIDEMLEIVKKEKGLI